MGTQSAFGEQSGQVRDLTHRRRLGLERPEPRVPRCVVPHGAGRHDRAGRDDAPADDARHELGDDLFVPEPVLYADDGGVRQGRTRALHGRARVERLGGNDAEVGRGQFIAVGSCVDLGGEVRQSGDPQPP